MNRVTVAIIVLAVLAIGSSAVYLWNGRRRAKRLTMELLNGYFQGDIDARQFARRMRESGDYGFTADAEFYALVTGAFQRAADAQLAHHPHTCGRREQIVEIVGSFEGRVWTAGSLSD